MFRIVALVAVISVPLICWFSLKYYADPYGRMTFQQDIWLAHHNSDDSENPRGMMINDLKQNHLKKGMSMKDVIDLLGEPDSEKMPDFLSYDLGIWAGSLSVDWDTLDLKFNEDGNLQSINVVTH